jgi:hypothetical protein
VFGVLRNFWWQRKLAAALLVTKLNAITAVIGILCPTFMAGTTLVVFVTERGIVLSSDSKTTLRNSDFSTSTGEIEQEKFVIIQNRVVVAAVGVSDIATAFGHYNFLTWVKGLQLQIPNHVSVDALAEIIQKESASTFSKLRIADFVKTGALKNKSPADPCEMFAQFVIVGYQDGTPHVHKIYFYIDWNSLTFTGPIKALLYPDSEVSNYRVIRFGTQQAIADFLSGKGYAHQQAVTACPKAMASIRDGIYPSLAETICLSRVLVEVEKSTNPSDVEGAVRTVKILPSGQAVATGN